MSGARTLLGLALLVLVGALTASTGTVARPNVLLISIDDMNDWITPFNDPARGKPVVAASSLQELANEGVAFLNAHTPVPLCRPTRASIVTGLYPRNNRYTIAQYHNRKEEFTDITTVTQHFRHHGYVTLGGGKIFPPLTNPERHWDVYRPFDRPADQKRIPGRKLNGLPDRSRKDGFDWGAVEYQYDEMSDVRIAEWAIRALKDDHDRPFFLGVGFHLPHLPWYLPSAELDRYPLESVGLPEIREDDLDDVPPEGRRIAWMGPRGEDGDYANSDHRRVLMAGEWKRAIQAYSAASTFIDGLVGRILDTLRQGPNADNTIVVLFADNGWHFGEKQRWRKMTLWEESTRVPLILSWPKTLPRGRTVDSAVSLVDLYPTLVALAGLPAPDHDMDGRSLLPLLGDDGADADRFAMTTWRKGSVAIRNARWRYIRYAKGGAELYDHEEDPMEHTNLLALPDAERHAERVAYFNRLIDRYHPPTTR